MKNATIKRMFISMGADAIIASRITFKSYDFAIVFSGRRILSVLKDVSEEDFSSPSAPL